MRASAGKGCNSEVVHPQDRSRLPRIWCCVPRGVVLLPGELPGGYSPVPLPQRHVPRFSTSTASHPVKPVARVPRLLTVMHSLGCVCISEKRIGAWTSSGTSRRTPFSFIYFFLVGCQAADIKRCIYALPRRELPSIKLSVRVKLARLSSELPHGWIARPKTELAGFSL